MAISLAPEKLSNPEELQTRLPRLKAGHALFLSYRFPKETERLLSLLRTASTKDSPKYHPVKEPAFQSDDSSED